MSRRLARVHPGAMTATIEPTGISTRGASALIAFTVLATMFSSRFGVSISGFNSDVGVFTMLAPLVAILAVARAGPAQALGFFRNSAFVFLVGPYLALMLVLPVLGVLFNGYEVRTIYVVTQVTTWLSFLVIGAAVSSAGVRTWSSWIAFAVVLQLLYALGQAAWLGGGPAAGLFGPLIEWDLDVQGDDVIFGRSSGLYTNPNILGLWAAIATILALTLASPAVRPIALALALLTMVLSQSRGATAALLAAVALGSIGALLQGRVPKSQLRAIVGALLLLVLVAPVVVIVLPEQTFERFDALVNVFTQGTEADQNLAGRLDFWVAAVDLSVQYPLGTWGNPEVVLGTAVDSSWFRAFAQGSIVLVGALLLLLLAPLGVGSYPGRYALWLLAIVIAVASLTQTAIAYPPSILYFALLGSGLQWAVDQRSPRTSRGLSRFAPSAEARSAVDLPDRS